MLDISKIWPEWKTIEKIGEGSFSKVYKCVREEYGIIEHSAVKVISIPQNDGEINTLLSEGMSKDEVHSYFKGIVNDLINEIKLMILLKNAPNIVPVENYAIIEREDTIGWDIYIRMDYLTNFGEYLRNRNLDENGVKKFGADMCNALESCARKGIIHCNIKPDNIFVDEYGNYRLGDFGIAKQFYGTNGSMSRQGARLYAAPEVIRENRCDSRSDIYSLGFVMYKLLNNYRDPFVNPFEPFVTHRDRNSAIERRMKGEKLPAPCNASPSMAAVILKAVEFRAEDRYANVTEFKNALNSLNLPVLFD